MKKFALTLTILSAFCGLICAGPEEYSGKEMKQVMTPPPPPECHNWQGFYIGAFGGFKFSDVSTDLHLDRDWDLIPDDRDFVEDHGDPDLDNSGAEAGGLIGYNFQFHCWVIGLEAAGGYLWSRESDNTGWIQFDPTFNEIRISSSFKTHFLTTFGPRLGYAFGSFLPYITGGLAVGDLDYTQHILNRPSVNIYNQGGNVDDTNFGWFAGGGLQVALSQHWSVRAQYQYIDLGSSDFNSETTDSFGFTYDGHHEADLREHNASFALIYGF